MAMTKKLILTLIAAILGLLSLLALHDVIYGWGIENLRGEFLILGITLLYFLWLNHKRQAR